MSHFGMNKTIVLIDKLSIIDINHLKKKHGASENFGFIVNLSMNTHNVELFFLLCLHLSSIS